MAPSRSETRIIAPVLRPWIDSRAGKIVRPWVPRSDAFVPSTFGPFRQMGTVPFFFDIVGLAANQLAGPGGHGQRSATGSRHRRRPDSAGQHLKGQGQQGVAGQDGHRLAEDLVAGGPAATQIVVVHGRQIVVDQRIGVDHFHGAGGGHGRSDIPPASLCRQQGEHRPQPFPRRQQAVTHGLPQPGGATLGQVGIVAQGRIDRGSQPLGVFGPRRNQDVCHRVYCKAARPARLRGSFLTRQRWARLPGVA